VKYSTLLLGFLAAIIGCSTSLAQGRKFSNPRFNYRLSIPNGWSLSETGFDVMLYSYKRSEALPQGLYPSKGAEIWVTPFSAVKAGTRIDNLDRWIQDNLTTEQTRVSITPVGGSKDENAPQNVVRVEADFGASSQDELQHEVSYYFVTRGRMFRLMLVYWNDNPNSKALNAICESVLRSFRSE